MRRKRKIKSFIISAITIIVILIGFALYWYYGNRDTNVEMAPEQIVIAGEELNDKVSYITETCFDGSNEVYPDLYAIPFAKTGFYIKNKDLVKIMSESEIEDLQKRATTIITDLYGLDYRSMSNEFDLCKEKWGGYFSAGSDIISDVIKSQSLAKTDIYVSDLTSAIINTRLQTEATFETDKSLVYEDACYYVRGLLTLTVYSYDPENDGFHSVDLSNFFSTDIEKGKKYQMIVELGLVPERSTRADEYIISHLEVIKY